MARIPYRHVERVLGAAEAPRLSDLEDAIAAGDAARSRALAEAIAGDLATDDTVAGEAAGAIELLVRAVAANRRALLPYRGPFPELGRIVKDPWRTELPAIDHASAIDSMPREETVSVRLDPGLTVELETEGPLGKAQADGPELRFTRGRGLTGRVRGSRERLGLLALLVAGRSLMPRELETQVLPRDLGAFARHVETKRFEAKELLDEGRTLVEAVERLVCRLYGLPTDLEGAVIAHAARRAGSEMPAEQS